MASFFVELLADEETGDDTARVFMDGDAVIYPGVVRRAGRWGDWTWPVGALDAFDEEAVTEALDNADYDAEGLMDRAAAIERFRSGDFVAVSVRWEQDGHADRPMRWEAWNAYAESIVEDAQYGRSVEIPGDVIERWYRDQPDDLSEWPLPTLREIGEYCNEFGISLNEMLG